MRIAGLRCGQERQSRELRVMKSVLRVEVELYDPDGNFIDDIIDNEDACFRVKAKSEKRHKQYQQPTKRGAEG